MITFPIDEHLLNIEEIKIQGKKCGGWLFTIHLVNLYFLKEGERGEVAAPYISFSSHSMCFTLPSLSSLNIF